jgi:ribosomal protein L22
MKKEKPKNDVVANVTIPVSTKYTVLIGKWIKGDNIDKAITKLEKVKLKKLPVPCVKYNDSIPHKRGMAAGRYPVKTAEHVILTLNLIKANAKHKGLDESKLKVNEYVANLAQSVHARGKYRRGRLTHLRIGAVIEK